MSRDQVSRGIDVGSHFLEIQTNIQCSGEIDVNVRDFDLTSIKRHVRSYQKQTRTLATIQNDCLQTILDAFKSISISVLEAETAIVSVELQLNRLVMKYQINREIHSVTQMGNMLS